MQFFLSRDFLPRKQPQSTLTCDAKRFEFPFLDIECCKNARNAITNKLSLLRFIFEILCPSIYLTILLRDIALNHLNEMKYPVNLCMKKCIFARA
jgi:hypothetical protein